MLPLILARPPYQRTYSLTYDGTLLLWVPFKEFDSAAIYLKNSGMINHGVQTVWCKVNAQGELIGNQSFEHLFAASFVPKTLLHAPPIVDAIEGPTPSAVYAWIARAFPDVPLHEDIPLPQWSFV